MDLTGAEDKKKRWQELIEEQYKKRLNDPDNHDHARHPPVCSQMSLRKHYYEQS